MDLHHTGWSSRLRWLPSAGAAEAQNSTITAAPCLGCSHNLSWIILTRKWQVALSAKPSCGGHGMQYIQCRCHEPGAEVRADAGSSHAPRTLGPALTALP